MLEAHRAVADRVLLPLAERMRGVNPNHLSWAAFFVAAGAGVAFYLASPVWLLVAALLILLNALLDALDGKVAKLTGRASPRGDFLDHVLDRYADLLILGGIALGGYGDLLIGFFAILGVLLTSYMGTQAQAVGLGRQYGGVLGRADRLVLLFAFAFLQFAVNARVGFGGVAYTPLTWLLLGFAVVGQATAIWRAVVSWRALGGR